MQTHRHIKLALICTVALAVPAAAGTAGTAGIVTSDAASAPKAKVYRHSCPINNPDYTGPKPADVIRRGA